MRRAAAWPRPRHWAWPGVWVALLLLGLEDHGGVAAPVPPVAPAPGPAAAARNLDGDGDGVADDADNCAAAFNPDQGNLDEDCRGDACDDDDDGDSVPDEVDGCREVASRSAWDTDDDGVQDGCDVCPYDFDPLQEDDEETAVGAEPDGVGDACDPAPNEGGARRDLLTPELAEAAVPRVFATVEYARRVRAAASVDAVAAGLRLSPQRLARDNDLAPGQTLGAGTTLRVRELHLIGSRPWDGVVMANIPARLLMLFADGEPRLVTPVGLGRIDGRPQDDWRTRIGTFRVTRKVTDPTWVVPRSIEAEMARLGQPVLSEVPPGPGNPLGRLALATAGGPLLHETPYRDTVFGFTSHGCVRLRAEDMARLFALVRVGTPVIIEYAPVLAALTADRHVHVEVHADPYERDGDAGAAVIRRLAALGAVALVDWERVADVVVEHAGLPVDVTAGCPRPVSPGPPPAGAAAPQVGRRPAAAPAALARWH